MAERKCSLSRPMLFWDSARRLRKSLDLLAQGVLPLPRRLQLLLDGLSPVGVEIGRLDLVLEGVDLIAANPGPEGIGQPGVDHLGQAAELFLDGLGLADKGRPGCDPRVAACRRNNGRRPRGSVAVSGRSGRCAAPSGWGSRARRNGRGSRNGPGGSGPSRAASVAIRMRSGCLAGSALKASLMASRSS